MYENAKPCIVMKMVLDFIKNEKPLTVMILEKLYIIIFVDLVMFKKMVAIVFFIDICTRYRKSSKNICFNICSHVSVMGNKHVFELIPTVLII